MQMMGAAGETRYLGVFRRCPVKDGSGVAIRYRQYARQHLDCKFVSLPFGLFSA